MAFHSPMIVSVHVLMVDSNMDFLLDTAKILQLYSFQVTAFQEVSSAYSALTKGDTKFDVALIDLNLSGYKFMHDAINMGLTVILTSANANAATVKRAIEDGALLVMEKPISAESMKYLWQHVLREKTRTRKPNVKTTKKRNPSKSSKATTTTPAGKPRDEFYINFDHSTKIKPATTFDPFTSSRPKPCTEWTPELHQKFVNAVRQLRDGRCFPKDILEIMNVPGLTRLQVASHLQKCRHALRKKTCSPEAASSSSSNSKTNNHSKSKRFGIVPPIIEGSVPHESPSQAPGNNLESFTPSGNVSINNNVMDEMSPSINYGHRIIDNMMAESEPEPIPMVEAAGPSFGVGLAHDHGHIGNNLDDFLSFEFDYDQICDVMEDPSFWSLWQTN